MHGLLPGAEVPAGLWASHLKAPCPEHPDTFLQKKKHPESCLWPKEGRCCDARQLLMDQAMDYTHYAAPWRVLHLLNETGADAASTGVIAGVPQHPDRATAPRPCHLSPWVTRDRSLHHSLPTPCSLQHPLRPQGPRVSVCPYQSISSTRRVTGPCSHCRHGSNDYLQAVQPFHGS